MRIITPVTDYIPKSILTTEGEIVRRGATIPEALDISTYVKAYMNAAQVIANASVVNLNFDRETTDVKGEYDIGTKTFTPDEDGMYLFLLRVNIASMPANGDVGLYLQVGGVGKFNLKLHGTSGYACGGNLIAVLNLTNTDNVTTALWQNTGGNVTVDNNTVWTLLEILRVPILL